MFTNITECNAFYKVVTKAYAKESKECTKAIRRSWDVITKYNETDEGRQFLTETFHFCSPLETENDLKTFKTWLRVIYRDSANVNYPYPTRFLEKLPAWPIKEICKHLPNSSVEDAELMEALYEVATIFFNYTGEMPCFNTSVQQLLRWLTIYGNFKLAQRW